MRISDWSSDVCSSDLLVVVAHDAVEEIVEADDRTVRLGLGAEVVLVEACRQVELVVDLVERVAGLAAQRAEGVGIGAAFGLLARRVIENDVVRIDEPDYLEPELATRLVAPRIIAHGATRID